MEQYLLRPLYSTHRLLKRQKPSYKLNAECWNYFINTMKQKIYNHTLSSVSPNNPKIWCSSVCVLIIRSMCVPDPNKNQVTLVSLFLKMQYSNRSPSKGIIYFREIIPKADFTQFWFFLMKKQIFLKTLILPVSESIWRTF